jgi:hypothetical protein
MRDVSASFAQGARRTEDRLPASRRKVASDPALIFPLTVYKTKGRPQESFSYPFFLQLQEGNLGTADLFACTKPSTTRVLTPGNPQADQVAREGVTGEYFSTLGIYALISRTITPDDARMPNGNPVAVIGYSYWKRVFRLGSAILGKTLTIADVPFTVVGVAPPEFFGVEVGSATDVWVPLNTLRSA